MGAGRIRFWRGPSFTYASLTTNSSTSTSLLRFSALAMAESKTFSTVGAMRLLVWRKMIRASLAERPRIKSTTNRAFCGDDRIYRASALACIVFTLGRLGALFRGRRGGLHRMALEYSRRGKLTQLVAHHIFGDVHRNEFLPVVDAEGMANEIGNDGGPPRPGPHHFLFVLVVHVRHLLGEVIVDERPFFE